jgi:hypothetical protein
LGLREAGAAGPLAPKAGTSDVMAWIETKGPEASSKSAAARPIDPATIVLETSTGPALKPLTLPLHARNMSGQLLIFKNVPPGKAVLSLSGRYWTGDRLDVSIAGNERLVWTQRPVEARPVGSVTVRLPAVREALKTELLQCKETSADCTVVDSRAESNGTSTAIFERVPAGKYTVVVHRGEEKVLDQPIDVTVYTDHVVPTEKVRLHETSIAVPPVVPLDERSRRGGGLGAHAGPESRRRRHARVPAHRGAPAAAAGESHQEGPARAGCRELL